LLTSLSAVCLAGRNVVMAVDTAINSFSGAGIQSQLVYVAGNLNVSSYCRSSGKMGSEVLTFFAGCFCTVVSQAGIIAAVHGEKERLREEQFQQDLLADDDFDERSMARSTRMQSDRRYELKKKQSLERYSDVSDDEVQAKPWSNLLG
jgi:hypothetical protein